MSMPEEKKVVVVTETAKEKAAAEAKVAVEEEAKTETKVIVGKKKTEVVFTSTYPVGGKEYTDELHAWELEHAIKAVEQPEPPKE